MKNYTLILISIFFYGAVIGQTKTIPTPDYANQIYYYDTATNELTKLEVVNSQFRFKGLFNPIPGAKPIGQFRIDGKKSPIRISASKSMTFLLKLSYADIDPSNFYNFTKLYVHGKGRVANLFKIRNEIGGLNPTIKSVQKSPEENIIFKKIDSNVVLITVKTAVEPGEYAFYYGIRNTGALEASICFAFGVD